MTENHAARNIIALISDLMFRSKIDSEAKIASINVSYAKTPDELNALLELQRPELIIVDLNSKAGRPIEVISMLKSSPQTKEIPLLGFVSHVDVDTKEAALKAGCDTVIPRSRFSKELRDIVRGSI